ncbi:MAG: peptidoglycan-binding protein [Cyanobacteria bacterium P01_C01_bin.118]
MSTLGLFARTRHTTRLSIKLLVGLCLLSAPAMAQTARSNSSILVAQLPVVLSEGSQGPAVRELQESLDQRGLFPSVKDGIYGPATTQAVRQFQRIRGLEVTGNVDTRTLDLLDLDLESAPVGLTHPVHGTISGDQVTSASSRDDVVKLQNVLNSFGFGLVADGVYGTATTQAIRTYQRTSELDVDGVADRETLLRMGFRSGGVQSQSSDLGTISSSSQQGRYVAAVITRSSDLSRVRRSFPYATRASNRLGDYISLGRFRERSDAATVVDQAKELGYDARVLRD